jgi:4-hydroxy-3-methylbut-2-enyl diphosphate reductase
MAVAPAAMRLVESVDDVDAVPDPGTPVALLAQTTLSHHDWADVLDAARSRWPDLWMPGRSDLCFATTNRQSALTSIAQKADAIVVIGSANSSNTVALEKVARAAGCARVVRVNDASEVPGDLSGVVGVTAGASAPEELVESVIRALAPVHGVELVRVTDEDEYFPPPRELREVFPALDVAAALTLGGDPHADAFGVPRDDRSVAASDVLASMAIV